ncbi:unnamed protein product [Rotaria sordida]|uniref:Uncharacterized protein n=1 Tax=Rotaria sordida TaxID=392033 RepID=A0A815FSM5_9BILA|nr:unnamed protein product [Rotaria sordida]CAF1443525.1 unnamed protein product [Rotaria sordida]CAF4003716.1 unnamed protein product [Rotaria sordida]CAF4246679.1 unnamed protein product [Rotaria sordida]
MAKPNRGHTTDEETFDQESLGKGHVKHREWIKATGYDTVLLTRDYYIAPTNYLLVFNNCAVMPTYIVRYSFEIIPLRIRKHIGDYCSFHNEYHKEGGGCDGQCHQGCLGYDEYSDDPTIMKKLHRSGISY